MKIDFEDLISGHEILDMAKRHDSLPDTLNIRLENSQILDFVHEFVPLFLSRLVDAQLRKKVERLEKQIKQLEEENGNLKAEEGDESQASGQVRSNY
jgi:cell division protein FtsL